MYSRSNSRDHAYLYGFHKKFLDRDLKRNVHFSGQVQAKVSNSHSKFPPNKLPDVRGLVRVLAYVQVIISAIT